MLTIWDEDFEAADKALATLATNYVSIRVAIATAVAEQRERCATIAERHRLGDPMARAIAENIRKNVYS